MTQEITTPAGRIVWGHPTKSRTKTDQKTRQPILKDGQPVQQWGFGLAIPKAEFQTHIWPVMHAEMSTAYPQGPPNVFSWKYIDGDANDREGKPYSQREGYAGCYVLSITSELMAPPVYKLNGNAYQQLAPDAVKCGDWVSVAVQFKVNIPNDKTFTPGLYVNPQAIEFVGYGTEIVSQATVDPMAVFKGASHQLPPGASATPMAAPGGPGMPGVAPPLSPPGMGQLPAMSAPPAPGMTPPAVMAPPPPPPGPQRPTNPTHIAPDPTRAGAELWWNGQAWTPAPMLPPPAPDFVQGAAPGMPGMPPPR